MTTYSKGCVSASAYDQLATRTGDNNDNFIKVRKQVLDLFCPDVSTDIQP